MARNGDRRLRLTRTIRRPEGTEIRPTHADVLNRAARPLTQAASKILDRLENERLPKHTRKRLLRRLDHVMEARDAVERGSIARARQALGRAGRIELAEGRGAILDAREDLEEIELMGLGTELVSRSEEVEEEM